MDSKGIRWRQSSPGLVCVCLDAYQKKDVAGRFYHRYDKGGISFQSVAELVMLMERLFDEINYPQAFTRLRSFHKQKVKRHQKKEGKKMTDDNDFLDNRGEAATFIVHVQFRQNATWQGEVVWAEQQKKICFRSALELLKLMDGAMNKEE